MYRYFATKLSLLFFTFLIHCGAVHIVETNQLVLQYHWNVINFYVVYYDSII